MKRMRWLAVATAGSLALTSAARAEAPGQGLVSITFDDASHSQYDLGFRAVKDHGLVGTLFVVTSKAEEATQQGHAYHIGWAKIRAFQRAGWEIGSHTHTHRRLTELDDAAAIDELETSKELIAQRVGVTPLAFAPPYGDIDQRTTTLALERYSYQLRAWGGNRGKNLLPTVDPTQIGRTNVLPQDSPADLCGSMQEAARQGYWLVLMFHEFVKNNPGEYQYDIDDFRAVLDCARSLQDQGQIRVVTVSEAMALIAAR